MEWDPIFLFRPFWGGLPRRQHTWNLSLQIPYICPCSALLAKAFGKKKVQASTWRLNLFVKVSERFPILLYGLLKRVPIFFGVFFFANGLCSCIRNVRFLDISCANYRFIFPVRIASRLCCTVCNCMLRKWSKTCGRSRTRRNSLPFSTPHPSEGDYRGKSLAWLDLLIPGFNSKCLTAPGFPMSIFPGARVL